MPLAAPQQQQQQQQQPPPQQNPGTDVEDPEWERDRQMLLRETEMAAVCAANAATVAKEAADRALGVRNTLMGARSRNPSDKSGGSKPS